MKAVLALGVISVMLSPVVSQANPMRLVLEGEVFSDSDNSSGSQESFDQFFGGNTFELDLPYNSDAQTVVQNEYGTDHIISDIGGYERIGDRYNSLPYASVFLDLEDCSDGTGEFGSEYNATVESWGTSVAFTSYSELEAQKYAKSYYDGLIQGFYDYHGYYPPNPDEYYQPVSLYLSDYNYTYLQRDLKGEYSLAEGIDSLTFGPDPHVAFLGYVQNPVWDDADGYITPYYGYTFHVTSAELLALPEPNGWFLLLLGFGIVGVTCRTRRRSFTEHVKVMKPIVGNTNSMSPIGR